MFAIKTVWHRSKVEAGVNVLGMIGDSWEQMEHIRTIRTEGGRGAGLNNDCTCGRRNLTGHAQKRNQTSLKIKGSKTLTLDLLRFKGQNSFH